MRILVGGAGGFIGGHLVKRLLDDGHEVDAADIKPIEEWHQIHDTENHVRDLRDPGACRRSMIEIDRVYDLAADMGGMGFIETHKLDCSLSVLISTNMLRAAAENEVERFLFTSSACVYPGYRQDRPDITALCESDAYPADPEDGYGWEKLFSERLCRHFGEETQTETRIARFHNVYGINGTYQGGREKAPAAICRKVAEAKLAGDHRITIWGDGEQTRSFCYIDDAVEGLVRLMSSDFADPLNIGSSEVVSINELVSIAEEIAGVSLERSYDLTAPQGVRGRSSENTLCRKVLDWEPSLSLREGMTRLYRWIEEMVGTEQGLIT